MCKYIFGAILYFELILIFFYSFTQNARIIRMPDYQLRSLEQEPYEFSSESRSADTEWDQLVKFALRKAER